MPFEFEKKNIFNFNEISVVAVSDDMTKLQAKLETGIMMEYTFKNSKLIEGYEMSRKACNEYACGIAGEDEKGTEIVLYLKFSSGIAAIEYPFTGKVHLVDSGCSNILIEMKKKMKELYDAPEITTPLSKLESNEETSSISKESNTIDPEAIIEALSKDLMAPTMITRYADADEAEKSRMMEYLKSVLSSVITK